MSDTRQQFLINAYKEAHKSCKEIHVGWVTDVMKQQTEECTRRMFQMIIESSLNKLPTVDSMQEGHLQGNQKQ